MSTLLSMTKLNRPVTVVFLSCKRIELFKENFLAFWEHCHDADLIDSFIILDDNSSAEDRKVIQDLASLVNIPNMIVQKNIMKGLAQSLNLAFDLCKTKYLFIVEDDWLFVRGGHFLRDAIEVMDRDAAVKKVCVDFGSSGRKLESIAPKSIHKTGFGEEYFINKFLMKPGEWPSFTFRQGLLDKEDCEKYVGRFREKPEQSHDPNHPPTTETDYAVRFCNAGFYTAYFINSMVEEKFGPSCYDLNSVNRLNET